MTSTNSFFDLLLSPTFILLTVNALIGLALFEWAWAKSYRFRNPIKELDDMFPATKRIDATKWKKWYFYPGAVTLLLPRFVLGTLCFASMVMWINITMIGQERNAPIGEQRKRCLLFLYKFHTYFLASVTFFTLLKWERVSNESVGSYKEYLGDSKRKLSLRDKLGAALPAASLSTQSETDTASSSPTKSSRDDFDT